MESKNNYLSCKEFFVGMILVNLLFQPALADVDDRSDKSLEARLHNIYEKHYSREVLDADWFKVIESVQQQKHVVKNGDTLWGISTVYFGDGNYWSKLWSVNRNITNPHLIFNGNEIAFTTGSFTQPPSISVADGEGEASGSALPLAQGDSATSTNSESGGTAEVTEDGEHLKQGGSKSMMEMPTEIPAFFKYPDYRLKKADNLSSIEPRPDITPVTEVMLTQEILKDNPRVLCSVKSVGAHRVITGESGIIVLECRDQAPAVGTTLSVLDSNIEEIDAGHVIKVLGIVKVRKALDKNLFEANVIDQYDGIVVRSPVSSYIPSKVSIESNVEPKLLPMKILNANQKSIWSSGDYVFMKMTGAPGNVGDVLEFSNKYDKNINSYLLTAMVKIVSTQGPFATGIVLSSRNALKEDSVSEPVESDTWFF